MCGGSDVQKRAYAERKPFKLRASEDEAGVAFYQKYVAAEVVRQWSDLLEFNPEQAARMLDETPEEYRCETLKCLRAPLTPADLCCHLTPWQTSVQAGGHRLYQGHGRPG